MYDTSALGIGDVYGAAEHLIGIVHAAVQLGAGLNGSRCSEQVDRTAGVDLAADAQGATAPLSVPALRSVAALLPSALEPLTAVITSCCICNAFGVVTVRLPTFTTPLAPTTMPLGSAKMT